MLCLVTFLSAGAPYTPFFHIVFLFKDYLSRHRMMTWSHDSPGKVDATQSDLIDAKYENMIQDFLWNLINSAGYWVSSWGCRVQFRVLSWMPGSFLVTKSLTLLFDTHLSPLGFLIFCVFWLTFNKSTTIFHGLHSYRPQKWHLKIFKIQVDPPAAGAISIRV